MSKEETSLVLLSPRMVECEFPTLKVLGRPRVTFVVGQSLQDSDASTIDSQLASPDTPTYMAETPDLMHCNKEQVQRFK